MTDYEILNVGRDVRKRLTFSCMHCKCIFTYPRTHCAIIGDGLLVYRCHCPNCAAPCSSGIQFVDGEE